MRVCAHTRTTPTHPHTHTHTKHVYTHTQGKGGGIKLEALDSIARCTLHLDLLSVPQDEVCMCVCALAYTIAY